MPRLDWSILCRRALIDKFTNYLTIVDVMNEASLDKIGETPSGEQGILLNCQLVSLWTRNIPSESEKFWQVVTMTTPDGETPDYQIRLEGDLENHQRTRLVVRLSTVKYGGPGTYYFNVRCAETETGAGELTARVPFELKLNPPSNEPPS